jgi:hypothetical protein
MAAAPRLQRKSQLRVVLASARIGYASQGHGAEEGDVSTMSAPLHAHARRKLLEFSADVWQALELLAIDSGRSVQALADEAFIDLLSKYHRPTSLKEALRESARRLPANDDAPPKRHGT